MSDIRPVVISGPSGVGKSTLLKKLFLAYPDAFGFSVSHTTRPPRDGEQNGVDYHFVTKEHMETEVGQGNFIEYASFAGKMYGTSKSSIQDVLKSNKICILDIDEQGVKNVKAIPDFDAVYLFVSPPSMEELESRLRGRGTETEDSLKSRMDTAKSAVDYSKQPGVYDLVLVNDNLESAFSNLLNFLRNRFPTLLNTQAGGDTATSANVTIDVPSGDGALVKPSVVQLSSWLCNIL